MDNLLNGEKINGMRRLIRYGLSGLLFTSILIISPLSLATETSCDEIYKLNHASEFYRDAQAQLSFNEIGQRQFEPMNKFTFGFTSDAIWLKTKITLPKSCALNQDWRLQINPPYTDHIDIYWVDPQNQVNHIALGDRVISIETEKQRLPSFLVPPTILNTDIDVYLRISGKNALAIDLELLNQKAYLKQEKRAFIVTSLAVSLMFILTLMASVHFILFKNWGYLLFGIFNISLLFVGFLVYGLSNVLFAPRWGDILATLSQSLNPVLLYLLSAFILHLRQNFPRIFFGHFILLLALSIWGLVTILIDQISWSLPWIQLVSSLSLLLLLIYSALLWKKESFAKLYFLMILLLLLGYSLQVSALNGLINRSFLTDNAPAIILLINAILIYVALNYISLKERLENAILKTKAEESLNEVKIRRLFTTLLSHELRTPLAIMSASNRNLMEEKEALSPFLQDTLIKQKAAVSKMKNIMDLCLTKEHLQLLQSKQHYLISEIWNEISNKAEEICRPLNRNLVFKEKLNSNAVLKSGRINLQQLLIAFGLILDNAIKYSFKDSDITLSIEIINHTCALKITNEGLGFSDNVLQQKAFERGENVAHTSGLGLGLIITHEIIEKMQGDLKTSNVYAADDKKTVIGSQVSLIIPLQSLST